MVKISDKVKISFMIDVNTKKTIKQMALDKDTTATEIYNEAINQYIRRETSQTTLDK